ncbi:MAG: hypothetical protein LBL07_04415 [Tannerella sp.]|jgi:drug/metabolite transporter (DMT)-like permease|nr:hypothetical protein [Tannerella sp.]
MDRIYRAKETGRFVILGIIIFGILEIGFIRLVHPSYYTNRLLLIPAYFLLLGISVLFVLSRMKRNRLHPGRAIARLMLFNAVQMLQSFFLLFCYYYFTDVQEHTVLIAFSVFYVFFMGMKLFILYNIDKLHKIETKRLRNAEKNK